MAVHRDGVRVHGGSPLTPFAPSLEAEKSNQNTLNAVVEDVPELPSVELPELIEAPQMAKKLENARQMAKDNPTAVANIVRDWVNGESAAA